MPMPNEADTEDLQDEAPALESTTTDITVEPEAPKPDADRGQTRKERREAVGVDYIRELRESRTALETERSERQRIDRELAELRGRFSATEQRGQGDDLRTKLTALRQKANGHLANASAASKNPEMAQREMDAYYDTMEAIDDARDNARWEKRRGEIASSAPDPDQAAIKHALVSEFPWLQTNRAAMHLADGYRNAMLADGKPDTHETFRAACTIAAQQLKIGGSGSRPTNGQRERYTGIGSGEGAGNGGARQVVKMDEHLQKMAEARYPELSAPEAHAKWAREIGSKLQANGAR